MVMRKRIKKRLVARATPTYVIQLQKEPKSPFVKIFGEWKPIKNSEIPKYKGFQIEWR